MPSRYVRHLRTEVEVARHPNITGTALLWQCPMRPKSQQQPMPKGHPKANRRFTIDQRDTWVGSHICAAEECGASQAFQEKYVRCPET